MRWIFIAFYSLLLSLNGLIWKTSRGLNKLSSGSPLRQFVKSTSGHICLVPAEWEVSGQGHVLLCSVTVACFSYQKKGHLYMFQKYFQSICFFVKIVLMDTFSRCTDYSLLWQFSHENVDAAFDNTDHVF